MNPSVYTHLSLDRWAKIFSLNPAHFHTAYGGSVTFPINSGCDDVWFKHAWQRNDRISREELAQSINRAEYAIATVLGYYPAPTYISKETHQLARYHRSDRWAHGMLQTGGRGMSITASHGRAIAVGPRAVALAATVTTGGGTLAYSDEDGDGAIDTATITVTLSSSSDAGTIWQKDWFNGTVYQHLGVYAPGKSGNLLWKVRDPFSWSVVANGSDYDVVIKFRPWQLIKEDEFEVFPVAGDTLRAIDFTDTSKLYDSLEIYLDYPDQTAAHAYLYWDNNDGYGLQNSSATQEAVGLVRQQAAMTLRNPDRATFVPYPASWDATNEQWVTTTSAVARNPDFVDIYYYSGNRSSQYKAQETPDPLDDDLAQAIALLAAARLPGEVCACSNVRETIKELQHDLVLTSPQGNFAVGIDEVMNNPFGTRRGEVEAWRIISRLSETLLQGGVL